MLKRNKKIIITSINNSKKNNNFKKNPKIYGKKEKCKINTNSKLKNKGIYYKNGWRKHGYIRKKEFKKRLKNIYRMIKNSKKRNKL